MLQHEGNRIVHHPILGEWKPRAGVTIFYNGRPILAQEGDTIAAALLAAGISVLRYTKKRREPRGIFCAIGQCSDCIMTVNGEPNVRTCITPVENGMKVCSEESQWKTGDDQF